MSNSTVNAGLPIIDGIQLFPEIQSILITDSSTDFRLDKDLEPEDANDHLINSMQYAWIPYTPQIGGNK